MINVCQARSRGVILAAVSQVNPELNPELQRRDVTGDGIPETFCNVFIRLVLAILGLVIPPLLANDLLKWFAGPGADEGWARCTKGEAALRAELGFPTVGVWRNPSGTHGHVVLVVPAIGGTGIHTAQAGARNWSNAPIEGAGLLADAYTFFTHD